jgi:hypothetical protein
MKYRITVKRNGNEAALIVSYDADGMLQNIEVLTPGLTSQQIRWMVSVVEVNETEISCITAQYPFVKVDEIPMEVSFPIFWEVYGYKVGRLQAEREWNKLSRADQGRAIMQASRYHQWRKHKNPTPEALHPERYLKNRRFDDEFKS